MSRKSRKRTRECCRCLATDDLTLHHIWPQARGGDDRMTNLCTLCNDCHVSWHRLEVKSGWGKLARGKLFRYFHAWVYQGRWLRFFSTA